MDACISPVVIVVAIVATVAACVALGAFFSWRDTDTAVIDPGSAGARCVPVGSPEHQRARLDWLDRMARAATATGSMLMVSHEDAAGWQPARDVELNVESWHHPTELVALNDIRIRRRKGNGIR